VVLSVFGGTPLLKPFNCKIRFLIRAAGNRSQAHHTGVQPMLVFAKIGLSPNDITWMSRYIYSRSLCLWFILSDSFQGNKKPCLLS